MTDDVQTKRIAVLTAAAKAKSESKTRAAEQAIRALVERGEQITFQAIQREAGVSHAFLYGHADLRGRIEHLRGRTRPNPTPTSAPDSREHPDPRADRSNQRAQEASDTDKMSRPCGTPWRRHTGRTSTYAANSPDAEPAPAPGHTPTTSHQSQQRHDLHKHDHSQPKPATTGGTGKSHTLIGLGHAAVTAGLKVKYCTAADLIEQLYRGLAANSVGKIIDGLIRTRPAKRVPDTVPGKTRTVRPVVCGKWQYEMRRHGSSRCHATLMLPGSGRRIGRSNANAAAGVDEVTWAAYGQDLPGQPCGICTSGCMRGATGQSRVGACSSGKADGRLRPLGIASLEDKIVQRGRRGGVERDLRGRLPGFGLWVATRA